ncbi:hypothetical protein TNCV_205221 [Trichonephila clavipes]|nr:hypothetical protein TNCV_205221 [Trichonephila clavipes]
MPDHRRIDTVAAAPLCPHLRSPSTKGRGETEILSDHIAQIQLKLRKNSSSSDETKTRTPMTMTWHQKTIMNHRRRGNGGQREETNR